MGSAAADERRVILGAAGLVALIAAGLVLATSWFVSFPAVVLLAAWLIATAAMTTVFVSAFRDSRATGTGMLAAIRRSFKALGHFMFWFY